MTSDDAARVLSVAEGFDPQDPYSRDLGHVAIHGPRFGVPRRDQLQFFGDGEYARLFDQAIARIESLGGSLVEIDFAPFLNAARLLYEGPWVAERYAAVEDFINRHASAMHPITRQVIEAGKSPTAVDAFKAQYQLMSLKRASERVWDKADVIVTPTAGTIYEIARVDAEPIRLNTTLGYYTNFVNLLDLTGVAIPVGFRNDGLPFGVTIVGQSATDHALLALSGRLHRACVNKLGAVELAMPLPLESAPVVAEGFLPLAVCGAHMEGLPFNQQLRDRGGYLVRSTRTAANYRLFALPGEPPQRPGARAGDERRDLDRSRSVGSSSCRSWLIGREHSRAAWNRHNRARRRREGARIFVRILRNSTPRSTSPDLAAGALILTRLNHDPMRLKWQSIRASAGTIWILIPTLVQSTV